MTWPGGTGEEPDNREGYAVGDKTTTPSLPANRRFPDHRRDIASFHITETE